jgi:hypothetical protein
LDTPCRKSFQDGGHHFGIADQFYPEQFRRRLSGDIVSGGTESTSHKENFCARKYFRESLTNCDAIGHRPPFHDPQPKRQNLARDKGKVCILHISEQKFCTSIENNRVHTSTIEARTLNVEPVAIVLRRDVDCLFAEKTICAVAALRAAN